MVLVYLNFKLQGVVFEVKEVVIFILHRECDAIHIVIAAGRVVEHVRLWCLVQNLFKGLTSNIESSQNCRRFPVEQVLFLVHQVAVHEVGGW